MGDLYLEVYSIKNNQVELPLKSAICLLTLHYLNVENISLCFVLNNRKNGHLLICLNEFQYEVVSALPQPASFCSLPVFNFDDNTTCIAGFCSVLRQVVKCCSQHWSHLLGFRQSCLIACAEVSVWTKFCEIDLIKAAETVLCDESGLPEEIARLEQHLSKPIRVHNIKKFKNISHKYVEGPVFLLTDLLIAVPIYVILEKLQFWNERCLPLTLSWFNIVTRDHNFKKQLDLLYFTKSLPNNELKLPMVPNESLYKRDPTRYKPRHKLFTQQSDIDDSMNIVSSVDMMEYKEPPGFELILEENIPKPNVPKNRYHRKSQQLVNLVKSTLSISTGSDVIVDFCCGSGYLGLILAYCLPNSTIVLLDNKEKSLHRAKEEMMKHQLKNVYIVQSNLDYYIGRFQIGVSLHACGVASDLVIQKCLQRKADFIICPCCYGGIQKNHLLEYPQSTEYKSVGLNERSFIVLGHCADQAGTEQGENGMKAVDTDRCLFAMNHGYEVRLSKLIPIECTTRNNLIVATAPRLADSSSPSSTL